MLAAFDLPSPMYQMPIFRWIANQPESVGLVKTNCAPLSDSG